MEMNLLQGLNTAQKAAVTSKASVLQVLAPPGSGKTKTLTSRVAYLVVHECLNPQNVICCTFTIKAAREMQERLRALIGPEFEAKLVLGTFHSVCRRYLVAYGHLIGISKGFGIADSSDSNNIVKRIIKRLNLSIDPKAARARISHYKARGKRLEDLPKIPQKQVEQQEFITVFHEYEAALTTSNLLDYDDLLLRCVDLLRAFPACVSNVEALLIDEFQDTNVVQFELTKLLASAQRRITIVGDPDQSIYGFRSAEIENLRRMKSFFPETVVINLEENYRSASAVLGLAQDVIEQDMNRPQKKLKATHCHGTQPVLRRLPNPNEEALWIASEIKRMMTMTGGLLRHSDFAILLRSAYLSLLIEKALANSSIPYRMVGGQRFFDRVEIRIIIDYLRTISHPDNNQAFMAIINVPSRKIGDTSVAELIRLGEERKLSLWTVVQKVLAGNLSPEKLSKPAEQELGHLVNLIKSARQKLDTMLPATVPSNLIDFIIKSLDLENYLKKKYKEDHEDRLENVKELIHHASEVLLQLSSEEQLADIDGLEQQVSNAGQEVLARFLANIVLSADVDKSDESNDKPRVTISTIHSAKGLEWPAVFIPAVYDGSIPHSRADDNDEERRLLYVAMTRAQAFLTMTLPLTQSRDQIESTLSPFLPLQIHRHLAQTGPLFNDKVIEDTASILRRPLPSQEDLAKSLLGMTASESQVDDVWPGDGSRRPTVMIPAENQGLPQFGRPLAEAIAAAQRSRYSELSTFGRSHPISDSTKSNGIVTTMGSVGAFSTSNMSLGFTTANHQLKMSAPDQSRSSSGPLPPQKKPKLLKSASAQGNITSFFSKPKSQAIQSPEPTLPSPVPQVFQQEHRSAKSTLSSPSRASQAIGVDGIPKELSKHGLKFCNGMIHNRPAPLKEITTNARNRYANLYSSSPPEAEGYQQMTTTGGEIDSIKIPVEGAKQLAPIHDSSKLSTGATPLKNHILSRPATTMHRTSMSSIGQNWVTSRISGSTTGRKTLGVRRTMNGWENRKNK
ncbi:uncharacterized protein Z518_05022 [Rhinocladiella mackenziei CBS 650.93]|uniref:DNA 3'-5' helicase n=1 Tax=Rhinocladiella mackenziei CBS 650.93 TaxID=1442369 RepID=A0A0D2JD35_9EURO|nr:uncharacterized protein Z518_05022 [Rhinocladiella mackenziei CBS 650.93]KIX07045.1 hypothetical protein Z518_05022 [Rhinocladiella mackenziei CBS 650.93]